jgi:hypothetical protein
LHQNWNGKGYHAKISPRIPSSGAQNIILSIVIIIIIPCHQIYVAIENPLLIPSGSCFETSSYHWNSGRTADNVSHTQNLQTNRWCCFAHLDNIQDRIQVTLGIWYHGKLLG